MRAIPASSAAAFALVLAACSPDDTPSSPSTAAFHEITVPIPGQVGLMQTVRIAPAEPSRGDTIIIASVLTNVAQDTTPTLAVSVCGPSLRGTLSLDNPFISCTAYSMTTSLAPGDSAVDGTVRVVASVPGTWRLEVQQLRQPATWAAIDVTVR